MIKTFLNVGLAFVTLLFVACGSNSPSEVAKEFIAKAYDGNGEALIEFVHIPDNAKKGEKEFVDGKLKAHSVQTKTMADEKGGVKSIEILNEEFDDNNAKVQIKVVFKDNSSQNETFNLNKIDNQWKIKIF
ncbi:DUF4878 domain-containing protein [Campylobacter vulpis]|uniref:DUF4878 domain-containing protein n=1 Tax=Campylobacter vulpis TaxID=1655500 RepID=UPI001BD0E774|nr:DUF4878 domain-containing protein [Campylobacter vulpis]MBS4406461.1 DUF4878 domain-containing protein [Campylobacter vulpis]